MVWPGLIAAIVQLLLMEQGPAVFGVTRDVLGCSRTAGAEIKLNTSLGICIVL